MNNQKQEEKVNQENQSGSENQNHKEFKIVFLKGRRINLRLITKDDVEDLATWINDPEIRQYLSRGFPIDLITESNWVSKLYPSEENVILAIETTEGELIGDIGLHKIDYVSRTATTGTMIGDKNFHGKGYGSEAKMLLLNYAFNTLNLRKINSEAISFNKHSVNYSLKCGYEIEGVRKKEIYKNGRYHDMVLLAVFKKNWIPLWKAYQKTGVLKSARKPARDSENKSV